MVVYEKGFQFPSEFWVKYMTILFSRKQPENIVHHLINYFIVNIGVCPKRKRNAVSSLNSENLINNCSMNCYKFKHFLCYMSLCSCTSIMSLIQEVTGSNTTFCYKHFVTILREFSEIYLGKIQLYHSLTELFCSRRFYVPSVGHRTMCGHMFRGL